MKRCVMTGMAITFLAAGALDTNAYTVEGAVRPLVQHDGIGKQMNARNIC